jgi:predicted dehydrogenase
MRIGIIGLGTIGQTHLAVLRDLGVDEILGADPSPAARERASPYAKSCFADYRDMFDATALDAAVVATPPRTHRRIAINALEAGLNVLCEKPLALTIGDCEAVVAAAEQARGVFQVGFCHRFQPQVSALQRMVSEGAIGRPVLVGISFVHGLTEQGREWITNVEVAGGGVLFDSGSHAIDLFRYLIGDVEDVHGVSSPPGADVEDAVVACVRAGGVLGNIALSWKTPPWQGLLEVVGTAGRARVDYYGDLVRLSVQNGERRSRSVRTSTASRFTLQMRHFLSRVRGEKAPIATARDGLEATRLILRIYDERRTSGTRESFSMLGHMSRT